MCHWLKEEEAVCLRRGLSPSVMRFTEHPSKARSWEDSSSASWRCIKKQTPCETKARFLPSLLPDGSQESVLEVLKRGQFQAAIHVTISRCDLCARLALKSEEETVAIAAKLWRCGFVSEALRRNMPLSSSACSLQMGMLSLNPIICCVLSGPLYRYRRQCSCDTRLYCTPTPNKNGSYGIKVGVRMP